MAQMERSYQEEGYLKPTLLRLGSNNSITSDTSNGGYDDESGPVMFTDSCPCCGSKKRRCLTPSFEPRKKTILIDPSSLIHDGGCAAPPLPARTAASPPPPPPLNPFASFVFPNNQKSPPPPPPPPPSSASPSASFFMGSASNSISPPPTSGTRSKPISISSNPISISSNPVQISSNSVTVSCSSPEQRYSATPPRLQPNPFARSFSSPITYSTPQSPVISPNLLRRSVSDPNTSFVPATETNNTHNDQMTILPANSVPATTLVRSPSIAYCRPSFSNSSVTPQAATTMTKTLNGGETSSTTSSQNRDNPKVLGRLSSIKDSLAEMNKLLNEIIQEQKVTEDDEEEEEAEETEEAEEKLEAEQNDEEAEQYEEEEEEEEEAEQYEEDENIDNICKEIYEFETVPEENVISTERSGDAVRVRYMCGCGKRSQIVFAAV